MIEREVKAVVARPDAVRERLLTAGASRTFAGRMTDRRYDRGSDLTAQDQVLRLRLYRGVDGGERAVIAWKGPVAVESGYKLRAEHEVATADAAEAGDLIEALGYRVIHVIDRYVEYFRAGGATLRLEWYPRMDVLLEVEGTAEAIEAAVALTGIAREQFSADALLEFVNRYEARTGAFAAVALADLNGDSPGWPG